MAKPAGGEDAVFTFNGEQLKKFFTDLNKGIANVGKNTYDMSKKVASGVKKGMGFFAKIGIAFLGLKKLMQQIPEVGQAFTIAKDIMFRNLLWPLRKMLMPILQGILNWVRDNRAAFVRWGQYIANIFKAVITLVKAIFGAIKSIISGIMKGIGLAGKNVDETLNIITFKVNAVVLFLSGILERIGKVIGAIFEGLGKTFGPALKGIGEFIGHLLKLLGLTGDSTKAWKIFGGVIGVVLSAIVAVVLTVIDAIITLIQFIVEAADYSRKLKEHLLKGAPMPESPFKVWESYGKRVAGYWTNVGSSVEALKALIEEPEKKPKGVKDAIITKRGEVIHTDPDDYIIATKNPGGRGGVFITIPVTVMVTEGNAMAAGKNFAQGVDTGLRSGIISDMVRTGY